MATESEGDDEVQEPEMVEETLMVVSDSGNQVPSQLWSDSRQTIRFKGFIGKQEMLILLDSGSVKTFVSEQLVTTCALKVTSCSPMTFSTADGSPMQFVTMVKPLTWFMQGHTFSYDARVLPLKCYDIILGPDWLADHSPQWIHWQKKLIKLPHMGQRIQLQGLSMANQSCQQIAPKKLKGLMRRKGLLHCVQVWAATGHNSLASIDKGIQHIQAPTALQPVLHQFAHLF